MDAHGSEEWELRLRERTVRAGVLLTWAVCAALGVYFAATWQQPHRPLMTALMVVGVASGVVIELLPTPAIIRSRWREAFFLTWSLLEVGLLLLLLLLDGASSTIAALLVVPAVFAGVSYPPRYVIAVGALSVVGSALTPASAARSRPPSCCCSSAAWHSPPP